MEGVGPLLDRGVDHRAGGLAELCRISARLNAELLQRVDRWLDHLRAALLQVGRERVVVGAVQRVVVPRRRIAVRVEKRILSAAGDPGGRDVDARREQRQLRIPPAEQRKVLELPLVNGVPHVRRLRLEQRRTSGHPDLLGDLSDLELEIDLHPRLHVQLNRLADRPSEPAQFCRDRVAPDLQRREDVLSLVGRDRRGRDAGVELRGGNGDARQDAARRVGHGSDNRTGVELRVRGTSGRGRQGQRDDDRDEPKPNA